MAKPDPSSISTCDYRLSVTCRCGRLATHVCYVETIGNDGPQSDVQRRCDSHSVATDVIDSWTNKEWETMT